MPANTVDMAQIVAAVPDGVLVTDLQGVILSVNPALCRLVQKPASQLLGTSILGIVSEQDMLHWLEGHEIIETLAESEARVSMNS